MTRMIDRRTFLKVAGATGIVVACGGDQGAPAGGGGTAKGTISGTVSVSYPDEAGLKPKYIQQAADALKAKYSGLDVKIDHQKISSGDFYTKLLLALNAGDVPDVIHVGGDRIGELADAGHIEPLDGYLKNWEDWSKVYPASVKSGVTYQGKVWAIPYGLDTRFLYYRKDVFEKAGLGADWSPKNVDDILTAATAVKSKVTGVIPYALYAGPAGDTGTANHAFIPLLWAYGGDLQKDGKWIGDSPALRKALDYYGRAYKQELSPKEILTTTKPWTAMREKLGLKGELAMLFEGGWVYGGWAKKDQAGTEKNVGYLLFPTATAGPSLTIGGPGTSWYVTAKSKNKDAAWEFVKAFNTKDIVAKLNIEDPHPVARTDSAAVPEFAAVKFLVDSTKSLEKARFVPPDANFGKVVGVIQKATSRVATAEMSAEDAAKRYTDDLRQAVGADKVITQ